MKEKLSPQELLLLLRKRENRGFSILYDQYSKILFRVIRKVVPDEEESANLLQDTFIKIWKRIDDYDDSKGALYTWMLNIARNTAIDFVRSKFYEQQSKNLSIDNYLNNEIKGENSILVEQFGVRELVERLVPAYREIINLTYFVGFTQKEAAKKLNIPLGTLKTRNYIAMQELRKWI